MLRTFSKIAWYFVDNPQGFERAVIYENPKNYGRYLVMKYLKQDAFVSFDTAENAEIAMNDLNVFLYFYLEKNYTRYRKMSGDLFCQTEYSEQVSFLCIQHELEKRVPISTTEIPAILSIISANAKWRWLLLFHPKLIFSVSKSILLRSVLLLLSEP